MTDPKALPVWMRKKTSVTPWLQRINFIFRAAFTDLRELENGEWEKLLDDLHFAIFIEPRNRTDKNHVFNRVTKKRSVVWDALDTLQKKLQADHDVPAGEPSLTFQLEKQTLEIHYANDQWGGIFVTKFRTDDFATMLFMALGHVLNASMVTRDDFRRCANPTCSIEVFIPLRKPRPKAPAYCSNRCARIVAARNYRRNKAAAKRKVKKKKPK